MVILKQKRRPWGSKKVQARSLKDCSVLWYTWVIRGWTACTSTVPYGNWNNNPLDPYQSKKEIDCAHCPTCGMRFVVGVRSYTKRNICPRNKDGYGNWEWEPMPDTNKEE